MRMTGPFTAQIPLLIGIEVLTIVAFVLSILALCAGTAGNSLRESAILTFNTSSINSALSNAKSTSTSIPDWYEVNYLSVCSGMWNTDMTNTDKNQSTSTCVHQKAGYTFSLAQTLPSSAAELLPVDSSYGTLHTKGPVVLLIIGITWASICITSFFYGIVVLLVTSKPPLYILRVGYLASIPTVILFTISSAKITAMTDKMIGTTDISPGVTVHAWMGWAFFVSTWLGTGFMWAALGFSIAGAFKVASALQAQGSSPYVVTRHIRGY